jgi:primosomal protein N' (replication factor Y)
VAIKLAELTGAVVILGSATPDLDSYYRAQKGEYWLLELPERVVGRSPGPRLPAVEVVDMRRELRTGNRSIFSRSLSKDISEALVAGEQIILFLNRRGTATFIQCRDCGFVLRCRRCEVSLTYHSAEDELICHLCNYKTSVPNICPNCFSSRIKFLGVGTQRVEEEAHRVFPDARLLRWDRDVTKGRYSHDEILDRFLSHEADILIGTQMIAKGLDLPLVTLVGVINADINLYLPDFRAAERTFQILTQVAGRAGRGPAGGRVVVQTYTPRHYAIAAAAKHDYSAFYEREIYYRHQHETPPFSRLALLIYSHTNSVYCQQEAERMYQLLEQERDYQGLPRVALIGPTPAHTQRLRGRYRWQIVIRAPDPNAILEKVPFPPGWTVDIDPVSLV